MSIGTRDAAWAAARRAEVGADGAADFRGAAEGGEGVAEVVVEGELWRRRRLRVQDVVWQRSVSIDGSHVGAFPAGKERIDAMRFELSRSCLLTYRQAS